MTTHNLENTREVERNGSYRNMDREYGKKEQMILTLETLGIPIQAHGNMIQTLTHWLYCMRRV